MSYRVSALTHNGGAVSVILDTVEAARAQIREYKESGLSAVTVSDLDGRRVDSFDDEIECS